MNENHEAAVEQFRAALNTGVSAEEEVEVRWFLASNLWWLARRRRTPGELLDDESFKEALREAELAIALDRERNCGVFAQPHMRPLLQEQTCTTVEWDIGSKIPAIY